MPAVVLGLVWWEEGIKYVSIVLAALIVLASMWEARARWKEREARLRREREDRTGT